MDETYIRVKGQWRYLYRAVDKTGQTIDFWLTGQRDERAATRFLIKAIRRHGVPETITIDGSEANAAAIRGYNADHGTAIVIRQVKYWLLAIFGEVESAGTSAREMERLPLSHDAVFPYLL